MARILLNHVCRHSVGHVLEALRVARGLVDANPGSEVHLVLPDEAAWELCEGADWVAGVHRVPLGDGPGAEAEPALPTHWDWIIDDIPVREQEAMVAWYRRCDTELVASRGRGRLYPTMVLPEGLRYCPRTHVSLTVPEVDQRFVARRRHSRPRIAVLPAGPAAPRLYPAAGGWVEILSALRIKFPTATFFLTGARPSTRGQTVAGAYTDQELAALLERVRAVNCFDIGLWPQVALLAACDLLISPHAGFSMLASCVGTPWLTLSGGNWAEYFFNHVPFWSVLPHDPGYPHTGGIDDSVDGPRVPGMDLESLRARIPEIVHATERLLDPAFDYAEAMRRHRDAVASADIRRQRMPPIPSG